MALPVGGSPTPPPTTVAKLEPPADTSRKSMSLDEARNFLVNVAKAFADMIRSNPEVQAFFQKYSMSDVIMSESPSSSFLVESIDLTRVGPQGVEGLAADHDLTGRSSPAEIGRAVGRDPNGMLSQLSELLGPPPTRRDPSERRRDEKVAAKRVALKEANEKAALLNPAHRPDITNRSA